MNDQIKAIATPIAIIIAALAICGAVVLTAPSNVTLNSPPVTVTVDGKPVTISVDGKALPVSSSDGEVLGAVDGEVTYWTSGNFSDDLYVGDELTIGDTLAVRTITASTTRIGNSGSLLSGFYRSTSTVNADAITAGSATTLNMTLSGVVLGDTVWAGVVAGDLGGSTSTVVLRGLVTATDTVQVVFLNTANTSTQASFNAGPSTVWLQGTH